MDLLKVSRFLLAVAAVELLILLVPALQAAVGLKDQKVDALIVALIVWPPDALFILALLSMLATFYLFYHWILPYAREEFADDFISLALAVFFALQSLFLFSEGVLPYRFILVSIPLLIAWYKDRRIWIRYLGTPFEKSIEDWFLKARWTAIWTLAAACLFALFMHPSSRELIFGRQLASSGLLGRHFDIAVPGFSYFVFFLISFRSFWRTCKTFRANGSRFVRELRGEAGVEVGREPRSVLDEAMMEGQPAGGRQASPPPTPVNHDHRFDLFLSYNSKDKEIVSELASKLRDRDMRVWLDDSDIIPGRLWPDALAEVIKTARSAAVLIGEESLGPWQNTEVMACVSEFVSRKLPVIPVLLPSAPEAPELPFLLKPFHCVDLRKGLTEEGMNRIQWGVTGERPRQKQERAQRSDRNRILVTGATGTIGRQVVSQLLDTESQVRAMTRNPDATRLPSGVEVMRGDLTDPASLDECLGGVETVFLVWTAPASAVPAALDRIARRARRVVLLTAPHKTPHPLFQQTNPMAAMFAEIERRIEASGLPWTFLRPGMFAANALSWWGPQIRAGDVVRWPYADVPTAPIHERDVAAVAVRALLEDGHEGEEYVLTGPESLSHREQVVTIGEGIGRPLRFEEISPEEARREIPFPAPAMDMLLKAWAAALGHPALVTSTVEEVTGRPARTFRDWAADHAAELRT